MIADILKSLMNLSSVNAVSGKCILSVCVCNLGMWISLLVPVFCILDRVVALY